jgi:hypothetical protein
VPLPVVRAFGSPERSRWRALLTEREIQRPIMNGPMLYMTIRCKLADLERSCTANAIMGDAAVAQHLDDASYLWMIERAVGPARGLPPKTAIVRLPHDGARATAVRVPGMPLRGMAWRVRPDGSIDAVIGVPHRSGAPGHRVALLRVEAQSLLAGLSSRAAVDEHAIALTHANEGLPLAFVGNTLLWADRAPGRCVGPSMLRSRGLDDGAVDEIEVPGCIDLIDGGASGVLLSDWSTRARTARLWPLALAPTLQLGDVVDVQGALMGALELHRPTRTRYGGEELWVVARLARPMVGPAALVFFSQSGTQLRRRRIASGTPIVGAPVEPCRSMFDPKRAYGYGEQILATLPTGLIALELEP